MPAFARIQNGTAVETFDVLPIFTPEIMGTIVPCPPQVAQGWTFDGKAWSLPAPVALPTYTPKQLAQALMDDPSPAGAFARGLIVLLSQRLTLTQAQVVTAIANAAS